MAIAVIRVRGGINAVSGVNETLSYLNLTRINHCAVIPFTDSYKGMLHRVKDYITWGEIAPETLARLIVLKGEVDGGEKLTDEYVKKNTEYSSIMGLAKAITKDEIKYNKISGICPLFRLHPPIKGYEGVKKHYNIVHPARGGALGYRGEKINALLLRMLPSPTIKDEKGKKGKPAAKEEKAGPSKTPAKEKKGKAVPGSKVKKAPSKKTQASTKKSKPKKKEE
ncbi:MAG: 50S ribosomal protein L30 [Thermoplasmata archaeon]|nr:50S ribosomal protein L30 [Thermoplasmata archaeon]